MADDGWGWLEQILKDGGDEGEKQAYSIEEMKREG